jgi:hypothetical protein
MSILVAESWMFYNYVDARWIRSPAPLNPNRLCP